MTFRVIDNPDFIAKAQKAGFSNHQFKRLDALYLQAAAQKTLSHRTVDCDFDEGIFEYSYYKAAPHAPLYRFVIRKVGPRTTMYELWHSEKGKIQQSGLFTRVFERLENEITALISP